ncbi:MAG: hypothetical protein H0X55_03440 [Thermoleophilaceae bacterium]|jgi:multisubunit Na+/H+ antiporter MnhB subunit|nr:hypothetical protein [Thermoleophilaceae bacterium]
MRAAGAALQIVVLALVVAAAALALGELGMRWDDWVVLAVVSLGVVGVALSLYHAEYPSRSLRRRFGRSSGPDAPAPRARAAGRRR